jgi:hypothetical protein
MTTCRIIILNKYFINSVEEVLDISPNISVKFMSKDFKRVEKKDGFG